MVEGVAPVLITGATGTQCGAITEALLAAGIPVPAWVRDRARDDARAVEASGAELVAGDLRDRDSMVRAAEGVRLLETSPRCGLDRAVATQCLLGRCVRGGWIGFRRRDCYGLEYA